MKEELQIIFLYFPKMGGYCLENSFRIGLLELLKADDVLGLYCLAQLEQFFLNCRISEYHYLPCSFEITVVVSAGLNKSSL